MFLINDSCASHRSIIVEILTLLSIVDVLSYIFKFKGQVAKSKNLKRKLQLCNKFIKYYY